MIKSLSGSSHFVAANLRQAVSSSELDSMPQKLFWQTIIRHPWVMPYNRLAILVTLINLLALYLLTNGFVLSPLDISVSKVSHFVLANFFVAIIIRQQYVVNLLFKIATSVPTRYPLVIRRRMGKVYHFGGIHVGAFFSGSLWYLLSTLQLQSSGLSHSGLLVLGQFHFCLLLVMMLMALPMVRARYHNQFELVARFGSWTSLLIFWVQAFLNPQASLKIQIPVLIILTLSVALPWLRLKKVPVSILTPSSHVALADFQYGVTPFAGSSTDLSRNPLLEWHAFANVPYPGKEGFRLTISRAGDWTGRLIDDKPTHLWVKGIPTAGVGNIETLFKKVIWVATGSGIGPCVPHILANKVPSRLVWSTRTPHQTFGEELTNEILAAQPDAILWDTKKDGKPDLVKLAYQAYKEFGAEAIICISNKKTTWEVVYEFESRGIPAFGAIWDS